MAHLSSVIKAGIQTFQHRLGSQIHLQSAQDNDKWDKVELPCTHTVTILLLGYSSGVGGQQRFKGPPQKKSQNEPQLTSYQNLIKKNPVPILESLEKWSIPPRKVHSLSSFNWKIWAKEITDILEKRMHSSLPVTSLKGKSVMRSILSAPLVTNSDSNYPKFVTYCVFR